ncbi:MAG: CvpA family protein [Pseudolabrys sp.]
MAKDVDARHKAGHDETRQCARMNPLDAAIYGLTLLAVIMGFRAGLLRSLAAIFGYVAAMALAVVLTPRLEPIVAPLLGERFKLPGFAMPGGQNALLFAAVFLAAGIMLSGMLRLALSAMTRPHPGVTDRAAGAMLGAVRIVVLAVLLVLIFERIIPPGREPAWFIDSKLRPVLSAAGTSGLRSLPPEIADTIDRLKRERGL